VEGDKQGVGVKETELACLACRAGKLFEPAHAFMVGIAAHIRMGEAVWSRFCVPHMIELGRVAKMLAVQMPVAEVDSDG
jgi:hypothetical protein